MRQLVLLTALLPIALFFGAAGGLDVHDATGVETHGDSLEAAIDAYVEDAERTPGLAVALITPENTHVATAGRTGHGTDVTAETLFEIGSVTKVLTSTLLADMVADGTVALDDTVGELMPEDYALDPEVADITLRELATHTSGLPSLPETLGTLWQQVRMPSNPYAGIRPEDVLSSASALAAEDLGARGERAYSNLGPALLGQLLARTADRPYERLLSDRVTGPLGLPETRFTADALQDDRLARPHRDNLRPTRHWLIGGYNPSGGLSAPLEDMTRFLSEAMEATETEDASDPPLTATLATHWSDEESEASGLGWVISEREGERIIWHNGRTGGFYSYVGFMPECGRGVAFLSNASHAGDAFATNLLRGTYEVPGRDLSWLWVGFFLILVALAPLLIYQHRKRAREMLSGADTAAVGRTDLIAATINASFFLALSWKLGPWGALPEVYWWFGLGAALGMLAVGVPSARRLPWLPETSGWRLAWRIGSLGISVVLLWWTLTRL